MTHCLEARRLPRCVPARWRGSASVVVISFMVAACAGAQYRADGEHARLVAPVAIAEGDTGKPEVTKRTSPPASSMEQRASPDAVQAASGSAAPDPAPLLSTRHYALDLQYVDGQLSLLAVKPFETDKPMAAPRMMGRFAVELWIGKELIERVRFDFPLLAAEPPNQVAGGDHAPLRLAPGADVRRRVTLPASERATRAQLVDRATGDVYALSWPPVAAALQRVPDLPAEADSEDSDDGPGEVSKPAPRESGMERRDQTSLDASKAVTPGSSSAPPSTDAPLPSGVSPRSPKSSQP